MTAPKQLRRGNVFQEIVQADFIANTVDGGVEREHHIVLAPDKEKPPSRHRTGRIDIWIDDLGEDKIAVFEIKATDWDRIAPSNIRRNIYRHQKQLFDYVYTYNFRDDLQVTYGLIYPFPPTTNGLRNQIEQLAMNAYDVPIYWYTDLNPSFDPAVLEI